MNLASFKNIIRSFFALTDENIPEASTLKLSEQEIKRINQIKEFRKWYSGKHYLNTSLDDTMYPYANLSAALVEKAAVWLTYKPPIVKFREDIHLIMQEIYEEILDNSERDKLFFDSLLEGGITGDCFLYVGFDYTLNEGRGGVFVKNLPSHQTFVEYSNIAQKKELSQVMIQWEELREGSVVLINEIWNKDHVIVFPKIENGSLLLRALPKEKLIVLEDNQTEIVYANPYGELPFVHIKNLPTTNSVYGKSDLHHLIPLNRELNETIRSYKDNVDYTGNPITLLFGLSAKSVEKGGGRLWGGLPINSRVENLSMDSSHPQLIEYFKLLEKYVGLAHIPFHHLNTEFNSGYVDVTNMGIKIRFLPVLEFLHKKRINYEQGFKLAFEKAIRYANMFLELNLDTLSGMEQGKLNRLLRNKYLLIPLMDAKNPKEIQKILQENVIGKLIAMRQKPYYELTFKFQDLISENRMYTLMDLDVMLRNKLESIRGAMRRLDIEDPESKLQEIMEDLKMTATLDAMYQTMATPQSPETMPFADIAQQVAAQNMPGANLEEELQGEQTPEDIMQQAQAGTEEDLAEELPQNIEASGGENAASVMTKQNTNIGGM